VQTQKIRAANDLILGVPIAVAAKNLLREETQTHTQRGGLIFNGF